MNFKKYFFVVGVLILAMMRPGLQKTGVKNDFVWSEIKSGFGEQGQEFPIPTTNSQEYPLPLPPPRGLGAEDFALVPLSSNVRCFTVT